MSALETFDSLLFAANRACLSFIGIFIQIQVCFSFLFLICWILLFLKFEYLKMFDLVMQLEML